MVYEIFFNYNMYKIFVSSWFLLLSYIAYVIQSTFKQVHRFVVSKNPGNHQSGSGGFSHQDSMIGSSVPGTNTDRFEFLTGKGSFFGFLEEPISMNLIMVHEVSSDSSTCSVVDGPILDSEVKTDYFVSSVIGKIADTGTQDEISDENGRFRGAEELVTRTLNNVEIPEDWIDADSSAICECLDDGILGYNDVRDGGWKQEVESDSSQKEHVILEEQNSISSDGYTLCGNNSSELDAKRDLQRSNNTELEKPDDQKISEANYDTDLFMDHDDIVEQVKLELKAERIRGLATIQEESESIDMENTKIMQEPKLLTKEVKIELRELIHEFKKVHKSYLDKMRKLDVVNCQTLHSLGLIRFKDHTDQSKTAQRSSSFAIKSRLYRSLKSGKDETAIVEPLKGIIQHNFETVYVGHLGLSWEMLRWQFFKSQELRNYDTQECHRYYNQVAGEFQRFQVLLQRFMEDELFQRRNRIQNYTSNRNNLHSLLQVPVIKDDGKTEKRNKDDEYAITNQKLTVIILQSIQVFREFLRTEKDKCHQKTVPVNIEPKVFIDVLNNLRKKEKKLKDKLRSGSCVMKKLQKNEAKDASRLLIAQVELKLVSRVVSMSELTTDRLVWCHQKLQNINFSNRQVFLDPSFLLFPC